MAKSVRNVSRSLREGASLKLKKSLGGIVRSFRYTERHSGIDSPISILYAWKSVNQHHGIIISRTTTRSRTIEQVIIQRSRPKWIVLLLQRLDNVITLAPKREEQKTYLFQIFPILARFSLQIQQMFTLILNILQEPHGPSLSKTWAWHRKKWLFHCRDTCADVFVFDLSMHQKRLEKEGGEGGTHHTQQ